MKKADFKNDVHDKEVEQMENQLSASATDTNEEDFVLVLNDREANDDDGLGDLYVVVGFDADGKPQLKSLKEMSSGIADGTADFLGLGGTKSKNPLEEFIEKFKKSYSRFSKVSLHKLPKSELAQAEQLMKDKNFFNRTKVLNTKIDPASIDWKKFEEYGVKKDYLLSSGNLEKLLNGEKTDVVKIYPKLGGSELETSTRLYLSKDEKGNYNTLRFLPKLDKVPTHKPFYGYNFTEEEQALLKETGNLGKTLTFANKEGEFFVSVDNQTNQIVATKKDFIKIPKQIHGVELSSKQIEDLQSGKHVLLENLVSAKTGKTYDAIIQVNADKRAVETHFDNSKAFQSLDKRFQQVDSQFKGVKLSDEQRKKLYNGQKVFVKGLISDKTNNKYDAWVSFNKRAEQGKNPYKLFFSKHDVNNKQSQSQTQKPQENHYNQSRFQSKKGGMKP